MVGSAFFYSFTSIIASTEPASSGSNRFLDSSGSGNALFALSFPILFLGVAPTKQPATTSPPIEEDDELKEISDDFEKSFSLGEEVDGAQNRHTLSLLFSDAKSIEEPAPTKGADDHEDSMSLNEPPAGTLST